MDNQQNQNPQTNCYSEILQQLVRGDTSIFDFLYKYGFINARVYRWFRIIVITQILYFNHYRNIPVFEERLRAISTDLGIPVETIRNYIFRKAQGFRDVLVKTYGKVDHRRYTPSKKPQKERK